MIKGELRITERGDQNSYIREQLFCDVYRKQMEMLLEESSDTEEFVTKLLAAPELRMSCGYAAVVNSLPWKRERVEGLLPVWKTFER